ncbi:MAG TPA: hypothetical protein VIV12_10495 [Streptosporangiaceae bacterium]
MPNLYEQLGYERPQPEPPATRPATWEPSLMPVIVATLLLQFFGAFVAYAQAQAARHRNLPTDRYWITWLVTWAISVPVWWFILAAFGVA